MSVMVPTFGPRDTPAGVSVVDVPGLRRMSASAPNDCNVCIAAITLFSGRLLGRIPG
jgi:hypothetical protein